MVSEVTSPADLAGASDQEVVARARQGREEAYGELLRRYQGLAQDAFVRMVDALESYRPEEGRFSAWILRIANNAAIDHLRRRRRETLALEGSPPAAVIQPADRSDSTPARVDQAALRAALDHAIGRLREQYRRCIILRHIEERSYEDIAEIMDLPLGTVKTYLHRARNELKEMLGPLRDPSSPLGLGT